MQMRPEQLAEKGFFLFPCRKKRPLVQWRKYSTTDPDIIKKWQDAYPGCSWGVDCGKSGLFILDDDRGKNEQAAASLDALELEYGSVQPTLTISTPSGGFHYYYYGTGRNSASSRLGKGLDTRGAGGYVVAPCSPGYDIAVDVPIATAPQWLIDLTGKPIERDPQDALPGVNLDTSAAIARAIDYLQSADPAIEHSGGDHCTYRVACQVRDYGISQEKCLELMLEYWDPHNVPPWGDELADKVFNAYRYAQSPIGNEAPEAVFTPVIDTMQSALFLEINDLLSREIKIDYLVQDLIEMPSTGLIFGDPSSGKSFLAIALALAVACGTEWMGSMVRPGVSVYFAGEGRQGAHRRMAAWRKHYGIDIPLNNLWVSSKRIEFTKQSLKEVADELKRIEDRAGLPVVFSAIDTLARHIFSGGDENNARDVGSFINFCDALRDSFRMVVGIVHHSGKLNKEVSRGSSAIRGAMDWEFRVENKNGSRSIIYTKQKEGELPSPMGFTLKQVEISPGVVSAVPIVCKYDPTGGKATGLAANTALYLELARFEISAMHGKSLSVAQMDKIFRDALGDNMSKQSKSNALKRAKDTLYTSGLISFAGGKIELIEGSTEENEDE